VGERWQVLFHQGTEIASAAVPCVAPKLYTARLALRPHRREDYPASAAMWADPAVVRFVGGRPSSPEESWSRLTRYGGHWLMMGFGYWAIEARDTGAFVGDVGFGDFQRALTPSFAGAPEIGWALATAAWGQGLASEAIGAAVAWGDAHLASPRTVCVIDPDHAVSLHLAHKFGYREFARAPYKEAPSLVLLERVRPGAS
jgi:RimJ/RimL family protein N-acetyltransferase